MVKIKICGMRREEDIEMANKYKPDYIGFVFADSPRKVTFDQAKELSSLLNEDIIPVGVFVNEHMKLIVDLFKDGIIKIAQLHGDEDEDYIKNLKAKSLEQTGSEIPIINAIEIKDDVDYNVASSGKTRRFHIQLNKWLVTPEELERQVGFHSSTQDDA